MREKGELDYFSKKERAKIEKEYIRLSDYLNGIRDMKSSPNAMFVVDLNKEHIAVAEAKFEAAAAKSDFESSLVTQEAKLSAHQAELGQAEAQLEASEQARGAADLCREVSRLASRLTR